MHDLEHWAPKFPCGKCGKRFHTQGAVDQHMTQLGHYTFYCKDCEKRFEDENSLKMVRLTKIAFVPY
jgi:transcription elongation factor Elf1